MDVETTLLLKGVNKMSVRSKEELLTAVREVVGDENESLVGIIEDISDTIDDYTNKTKDTENWKEKYEQNDKEWRQKYTDRFFNNETADDSDITLDDEQKEEPKKPKTFEDLFTYE